MNFRYYLVQWYTTEGVSRLVLNEDKISQDDCIYYQDEVLGLYIEKVVLTFKTKPFEREKGYIKDGHEYRFRFYIYDMQDKKTQVLGVKEIIEWYNENKLVSGISYRTEKNELSAFVIYLKSRNTIQDWQDYTRSLERLKQLSLLDVDNTLKLFLLNCVLHTKDVMVVLRAVNGKSKWLLEKQNKYSYEYNEAKLLDLYNGIYSIEIYDAKTKKVLLNTTIDYYCLLLFYVNDSCIYRGKNGIEYDYDSIEYNHVDGLRVCKYYREVFDTIGDIPKITETYKKIEGDYMVELCSDTRLIHKLDY